MENDDATGMSHTLWRQYDSRSGRWTAPDPYGGSMTIAAPQSFNRYSYVENDSVNKIDPLGLALQDIGVEQTNDPAHARRLEQQSLRDHQIAINTQYAARHGGSVSYDGNRASFVSKHSAVNYFRRLGAEQAASSGAAMFGGPGISQGPPAGDEDVIRTSVRASGDENPQTFWQRRYAAQLQSDVPGTLIHWRQDSLIQWISFPGDFDTTVAALKAKGYLTGPMNFAFNPYHHGGGIEFRDPDSKWGQLSFHFMIPYPRHEYVRMPPTMGPDHILKDLRPARGIHVHVDFNNPNTRLFPHARDVIRDVWRDIRRRF